MYINLNAPEDCYMPFLNHDTSGKEETRGTGLRKFLKIFSVTRPWTTLIYMSRFHPVSCCLISFYLIVLLKLFSTQCPVTRYITEPRPILNVILSPSSLDLAHYQCPVTCYITESRPILNVILSLSSLHLSHYPCPVTSLIPTHCTMPSNRTVFFF